MFVDFYTNPQNKLSHVTPPPPLKTPVEYNPSPIVLTYRHHGGSLSVQLCTVNGTFRWRSYEQSWIHFGWLVSCFLVSGRAEILQPDNDRYANAYLVFFALLVCAVKTSLIGFYFRFLSGPLVENIKDVYSLQQLKQLMADLDRNPQQFPTLGIVYAFLTSFDIDNDLKRIIASRWWVQFCCVFHFSAQIKQLGFWFHRGRLNKYTFSKFK